MTTAWILGRRGLLGSWVGRALPPSVAEYAPPRHLAWTEPPRLAGQLTEAVAAFADHAAGGEWWLVWCAGAGVVGTGSVALASERAAFEHLLGELGAAVGTGRLAPAGSVFLSSSAGGVYAGAGPAPFDERTEPVPISDYGRSKLAQEQMLASFTSSVPVRAAVGRIANLYGPGQDLAKGQGLVSQLCRTQLLGQPLHVYVPFDTIRDYLYAPDCGRMVVQLLEAVGRESSSSCTTKVLASQRGTTVGSVLREFQRVVKRPPRVVQHASPLGALQVRDLRLRSVMVPDVDSLAATTFPAGLHATWIDLVSQFAGGALRAG